MKRGLGGLCFLLLACGPSPGPEPEPLSLVVIAVDGLGSPERELPPTLAKLAGDSRLLEDVWGSAPGLASEVASLFTGLPAACHGLRSLRAEGARRLSPDVHATWAELATERGLTCVGVSASPRLASELSGLDRGFASWSSPEPAPDVAPWTMREAGERWLSELGPRLDRGGPFGAFLLLVPGTEAAGALPSLASMDRHLGTLVATDERLADAKRSLEEALGAGGPEGEEARLAWATLRRLLERRRGSAEHEALEALIADRALAELDAVLSRLVARLRAADRLDSTTLVVTRLRAEGGWGWVRSAGGKTPSPAVSREPTSTAALGVLLRDLADGRENGFERFDRTVGSALVETLDPREARVVLFDRIVGADLATDREEHAGGRKPPEEAHRARATALQWLASVSPREELEVLWAPAGGEDVLDLVVEAPPGDLIEVARDGVVEPLSERRGGRLTLSLHAGDGTGPGQEVVRVRRALPGEPLLVELSVDGERPAEARVFVDGAPLSTLELPRLAPRVGDPWGGEGSRLLVPFEGHAVHLRRSGGGWLALDLRGPTGRTARVALHPWPPSSPGEEPFAPPLRAADSLETGLLLGGGLALTGEAPLALELRPPAGRGLAFSFRVGPRVLPASAWDHDRAGGALSLVLPAPGLGAPGRAEGAPSTAPAPAPGTIRLTRTSTAPRPAPPIPMTPAQLAFVRRLPEGE